MLHFEPSLDWQLESASPGTRVRSSILNQLPCFAKFDYTYLTQHVIVVCKGRGVILPASFYFVTYSRYFVVLYFLLSEKIIKSFIYKYFSLRKRQKKHKQSQLH